MILLGILCFAYYFLMCIMLRKWDSTFTRFWPAAGVCFLIAERMRLKGAVPELLCVGGVFLIFLIIFVLAECRILLGMIPCQEKNLPYLVILGAQVRGRKLSGSLRRRVEKAAQYLLDNPYTAVVVSGGQGKGEEITEASAMRQYLIGRGISDGRIFLEENSTTTEENLRFSSVYIRDLSLPVGIVTNNFHMYRACCYAKRLGYQNPKAVPAGCHPVFFVNYMVREFFALIKMLLVMT